MQDLVVKKTWNQKPLTEVIAYARRCQFETIDIAGGAPELNPNLSRLIESIVPFAARIMLRSNLSVLNDGKRDYLMALLKQNRVVIVASFPSLNEIQADSQRGDGTFKISIEALRKLNALGYGHKGSGLELDLVSNPTDAFLAPSQAQTDKRFHQVLEQRWGIVFDRLFNFANVPLGRYRNWFVKSENLEQYMQKLISGFNPLSVKDVMCRSLVSVSWDGYLYDCDFNLACELFMGGHKIHVSEMPGPPAPESHIATDDHCYTCTAGAGFALGRN